MVSAPCRDIFTASWLWYEAVKGWFIVSWTDSESSLGLRRVLEWFHNNSSSVFGSDCESWRLCSLTEQTQNKAMEEKLSHCCHSDRQGSCRRVKFSSICQVYPQQFSILSDSVGLYLCSPVTERRTTSMWAGPGLSCCCWRVYISSETHMMSVVLDLFLCLSLTVNLHWGEPQQVRPHVCLLRVNKSLWRVDSRKRTK